MHTLRYSLAALLAVQAAHAASLGFVNGDVDDAHTLRSTISGPTNQWIYVERLKYDTQVWQIVSLNWIDASGYCSFTKTNALDGNFYGIYRARTTNYAYLSTNAFGAVAGFLPQGYTMIGNPFDTSGTNSVVSVLRTPNDPLSTYVWRNGGYQDAGTYSGGAWLSSVALKPLEGVMVYNQSTNAQHYIVSGLISTNSFNLSLTNYNWLTSPLFRLQAPNTNAIARAQPYFAQPVDTLTAGNLGGASGLPVPIPTYYTNAISLAHVTNTVTPTYETGLLPWGGTNWLRSSNSVTIRPNLSEAFWLNLPTNRTWTVPSRAIWP